MVSALVTLLAAGVVDTTAVPLTVLGAVLAGAIGGLADPWVTSGPGRDERRRSATWALGAAALLQWALLFVFGLHGHQPDRCRPRSPTRPRPRAAGLRGGRPLRRGGASARTRDVAAVR
ncbi:MAG: hypothetical protein U5R31_02735 [Acidimicrobiia bacterium]|nr:hypothetical protein [Acidimicrobiia bacterium]